MSGILRKPQRLSHGDLTVLYESAPGPLTAIAVAVRAGARFDGPHPGIAHLAEHMLFQGTRSHDQAGLNRRAGVTPPTRASVMFDGTNWRAMKRRTAREVISCRLRIVPQIG